MICMNMYEHKINAGSSSAGLHSFSFLVQKDAIRDFSMAIDQGKFSYRALFNRANCHRNLKNHKKAIRDLKKAIEIDNASAAAYNALALTYCEIGEYDSALQYINKAIGSSAKNPIYLNNR